MTTSSESRSGSIWPPEFLRSLARVDNLGIDATFTRKDRAGGPMQGAPRHRKLPPRRSGSICGSP
jgi:hypothetical protein